MFLFSICANYFSYEYNVNYEYNVSYEYNDVLLWIQDWGFDWLKNSVTCVPSLKLIKITFISLLYLFMYWKQIIYIIFVYVLETNK